MLNSTLPSCLQHILRQVYYTENVDPEECTQENPFHNGKQTPNTYL